MFLFFGFEVHRAGFGPGGQRGEAPRRGGGARLVAVVAAAQGPPRGHRPQLNLTVCMCVPVYQCTGGGQGGGCGECVQVHHEQAARTAWEAKEKDAACVCGYTASKQSWALPPGKRAGQRHSMSTHIMRDPLQSAFLEHAPNVGGLNCAPRGVGSSSAVDTEPPGKPPPGAAAAAKVPSSSSNAGAGSSSATSGTTSAAARFLQGET